MEVATMEEVEEEVLRSVISVTALIMVIVSAPFSDAIGQNTMVMQKVIQEEVR